MHCPCCRRRSRRRRCGPLAAAKSFQPISAAPDPGPSISYCSSGAYPLPWLLLDLEQLLPPGCQLAQWLQADDARLCRRLEAAQDDRQQACRMAAVMLVRHSRSLKDSQTLSVDQPGQT